MMPVLLEPGTLHRRGAPKGRRPATIAHDAEILRLLASGWHSDQIAEKIGYSQPTVKNRLAAMRAQYGASTSAHLVALAYTRGDLPGSPARTLAELVALWRDVEAAKAVPLRGPGQMPAALLALQKLNIRLEELAASL